jgi:hypothetical protein
MTNSPISKRPPPLLVGPSASLVSLGFISLMALGLFFSVTHG